MIRSTRLFLLFGSALLFAGCGRLGFTISSDPGEGPPDGSTTMDGGDPGDGGRDAGADSDGGGGGADGSASLDGGGSIDPPLDGGNAVGDGGGVDASCPPSPVGARPYARMAMSPPSGDPTTVFEGDGSASSDAEDGSALIHRWDWNDDGVYEATGALATHSFSAAGVHRVSMEVEDSCGLRDWASFEVVIRAASQRIEVTTPMDEADGGATPGAPGGTGLSLREAIVYAQTLGGKKTVWIPSGMTITLTLGALPGAMASTEIVGDGAVLDGNGGACFELSGSENLIAGLEVRGCDPYGIDVVSGGSNRIIRCAIHDNANGVRIQSNGNVLGPWNDVHSNTSFGAEIGAPTTVIDNRVRQNGQEGIMLTRDGGGSTVIGNRVYLNNHGIRMAANSDGTTLVHNVAHGNTGGGLYCGSNVVGTVARDNVFDGNGSWGLICFDSNFSVRSHNDFHMNGNGACFSCSSLGAGSRTDDPLFVDPTGFDFRLRPDSPLVDRGVDLGYDRNGAGPGDFLGSAPDMGAVESY